MGYVTTYNLKLTLYISGKPASLTDNAPLLEIINQLRTSNEEAAYALCEDGSNADSSKWYEHEKDLRDFSRNHPGILFTLHGEGEENEDIWDKHFFDGKCQACKAVMTIPPFDMSKLK